MNGAPLAERFKQRSAYVAQEELFMPTLNAWETLEFQAFLRNRCLSHLPLPSHTWQLGMCLLKLSWTHFNPPISHVCVFNNLGLLLGSEHGGARCLGCIQLRYTWASSWEGQANFDVVWVGTP